jgi:hypothetical protein
MQNALAFLRCSKDTFLHRKLIINFLRVCSSIFFHRVFVGFLGFLRFPLKPKKPEFPVKHKPRTA